MAQQAIAKTVEVSTTDTFIINTNGTDQTINPSQTIFPNVFALAADINDQITLSQCTLGWNGAASAVALGQSERFYVSTNVGGGGDTLIDITGTLAATLGFNGSESVSGSSYILATYAPEQVFLPTYINRDNKWFNEDPADMFKGNVGTDGNLSGVNHQGRKKILREWEWEFNYNCMEYADDTGAATAIVNSRAARCFARIINDARQMTLAETGSSNKYCKGVYFIEDTDAFDVLSSGLPTSWDSGGVTPSDNYVFCSAGPPQVGGSHREDARAYYPISVELTQAVAPSWGWSI
jgi:hypothetical protein